MYPNCVLRKMLRQSSVKSAFMIKKVPSASREYGQHTSSLCNTGGGGFLWGVYFAWEIWCFKLTAKFTTQILGVSAKFPTLVVGTTKFSLAGAKLLCSLCILSGSGSQVLLRCCWQSVCLFRPLISVVVWRELHAPWAHRGKFRYMCFHGHCFFPASRLKGGLGGVGSGSGPRWSLLGSALKFQLPPSCPQRVSLGRLDSILAIGKINHAFLGPPSHALNYTGDGPRNFPRFFQ